MKMDPGTILYCAAGLSVMLPLGARFAGNKHLANRLDLIPRFVFGAISLLFALVPAATFRYTDALDRPIGPAPQASSRVLFGALGAFLLITGVRIIVKHDYDREDDD